MALESGTRLGHYSITDKIGKGGMGEVYRARDTKLGREVAIKVLPSEFSQDAERLARLEREARVLAALNHPNIAAIYGLEQSNDTRFLVLELVEGDTLADRLKRGAIPVEESLRLALQIAEALEAAHEKGVIHRDLKPANIKITPEGRVKVLDFGLAKAFIGDRADVNLSNSPTLSLEATRQGVILGTAAYMSPEQARGRDIDKRTDVWAFGCVVYEMLAGRPAFPGSDVTDILAAVIRAEPEWSSLPARLHPRVREVLERCLEKDANDRYRDVGDARADIRKALADPRGLLPTEQPAMAASGRGTRVWLALTAGVALFVGAAAAWMLKPVGNVPASVIRFEAPAEAMSLAASASEPIDISRDGERVLQAAGGGIYLRSMDEIGARRVVRVDEAADPIGYPVFSPDGANFAYAQGGQLWRAAVDGGAPIALTDTWTFPFGIDWASNRTILYALPDGIWQVSENGGTPTLVIEAQPGEVIGNPQLLPDGDHVLYAQTRGQAQARWDEAEIVVGALSGETPQVLRQGGHSPRYLPTGHLVYVYQGTLFASRFDPDELVLDEAREPMVDRVGASPAPSATAGNARYAVSDTGTLVYMPGGGFRTGERELALVSRSGEVEPIPALSGTHRNYADPRLSPDGTRVAVDIEDTAGGMPTYQIWIVELATGIHRQLTLDGTLNQFPVWTPDSSALLFASDREGRPAIYRKSADGVGGAERIWEAQPGQTVVPTSMSVDGVLAFTVTTNGNSDIWTLPLDSESGAEPYLATDSSEQAPVFSPDGTAIAYLDQGAAFQTFIRPYPPVDGTVRRVPANRTSPPMWYREGGEIVYTDLTGGAVQSVEVTTRPSLAVGRSSDLFPLAGIDVFLSGNGLFFAPWDAAPGRRLIIARTPDAPEARSANATAPRIDVVVNWIEELKERVPVP